jgi:hypothetical protein
LYAICIICVLLYAVWCWQHSRIVDNLPRRPVVITGCDSGFGRLLAIRLATRGQHVYAACLNEEVS